MLPPIEKIEPTLEPCEKYYFLYIKIGVGDGNVYIKGSPFKWLAKQKENGRSITLVNLWEITEKEYNYFK